ncbi:LTD1 [Auxenochlorella protothecoides x Auxenochlorella symbiontica]
MSKAQTVTVSRRLSCNAFFGFGKQNDTLPTLQRGDYTRSEVEDYYNYMGMLAAEGNYDKLEELFDSGVEPVDLLVLLASTENDLPKLEELVAAGADLSVKDPEGRGCMDLCTKPAIKEYLKSASNSMA